MVLKSPTGVWSQGGCRLPRFEEDHPGGGIGEARVGGDAVCSDFRHLSSTSGC